ncbi:ABC transporter ATP-binding protein [Spirochaeta lutea]|uniref:ABC transporter ATP-binding protein n=1 Tax=Spirochaeta lutea TaxID=1480694 RepID=UPI0009DE1100|nr:ABC transporter ATP-binding protein [Spirochaeta lutea]
MITINSVSKSYDNGRVKAVQNLNLEIAPGEVFGFLGPNGAGKSTTIKMLVGLLHPDQGTITLGGLNPRTQGRQAKKLIGYVPDEPMLYDKMTGSQYLAFIADMYQVPRGSRSSILDLAEEFEIRYALDDVITAYSHGMKQKLAIIAALLHDPEIFILDEPIVGLDPKSAFTLKEKMRAHCQRGKTVFFSTHVMEVAERLCDRVGIISRGSMIALGPFEDLRDKAGRSDSTLEQLFLELTETRNSADFLNDPSPKHKPATGSSPMERGADSGSPSASDPTRSPGSTQAPAKEGDHE